MNNCIVYCVDDNKMQTEMCIYSISTLVNNTTNKIFVCTLYKNDYLLQLKKKYNLDFSILYLDQKSELLHTMNKVHQDTTNTLTNMAFARLLLPYFNELKDYKMLLYIDNDTEICKNVDDVFNSDMQSKYFAMCETTVVGELNAKYGNAGDVNWYNTQILQKILKIKDTFLQDNIKSMQKHYYNSGVVLFNLNKIQNEIFVYSCILNLAIEYHNKFNFTLKDQDLLNLFFTNYICKLHYSYNFQINIAPFTAFANLDWSKASIIHWFGNYKKYMIPKVNKLLEENH